MGGERGGGRPGEPLEAGVAVGKPTTVHLSGRGGTLAAVLRPRLRSRRTGRGVEGGWAEGTSELACELDGECKMGSEMEPAGQGAGGSVAGGGVELNPVSAGSVDRWGVKLNLRRSGSGAGGGARLDPGAAGKVWGKGSASTWEWSYLGR